MALAGSVTPVGGKARRQAARDRVAAYHQDCLAELLDRVAREMDRYRAGAADVFDVDATIHQYHRAAQRLWSFCWGTGGGAHLEFVADTIERVGAEPIDWWQRGARPGR